MKIYYLHPGIGFECNQLSSIYKTSLEITRFCRLGEPCKSVVEFSLVPDLCVI